MLKIAIASAVIISLGSRPETSRRCAVSLTTAAETPAETERVSRFAVVDVTCPSTLGNGWLIVTKVNAAGSRHRLAFEYRNHDVRTMTFEVGTRLTSLRRVRRISTEDRANPPKDGFMNSAIARHEYVKNEYCEGTSATRADFARRLGEDARRLDYTR